MLFFVSSLRSVFEKVCARLQMSVLLFVSAVLLSAVLGLGYITTAPHSFTSGSTFSVASGSSMRAIAEQAKTEGYVRSAFFLYLILSTRYQPSDLYAGDYYFSRPLSSIGFAATIAGKQVREDLTRLTFPEGITVAAMADIASVALPTFDADAYLNAALPYEGRLFPETYFVPDNFTATDLIALQLDTYEERMASLAALLASSTVSEQEALVLASIVEREAKDPVSMRTVAGIYQNRLALGMPLQADASIEYVLDKPLEELTPDDLKIDSPYNTYLNTGLPPTPIGNPGLQAITAVLDPIESDFYYYITAPDGAFYYAKTLNEHNRNIERYLE